MIPLQVTGNLDPEQADRGDRADHLGGSGESDRRVIGVGAGDYQ